MEPLRKELAEGVFLTYVPAAKFKTGVLGAQLITPLEESTCTGRPRLHRAQEGRESMPRLCRQLS